MECKTISRRKKKKDQIVSKFKHETFAAANIEAFRINAMKNVFIKRMAYKCTQCGMFHVGTTQEMLKNKELPKPTWMGVRHLKVVGNIDLNQFTKAEKYVNPIVKAKNEAKLEAKMLKEKEVKNVVLTTPSKNKSKLRNKPIVGELYFETIGRLKFFSKKKTVKVITPDGKNRFIKYAKIYGEERYNQKWFAPTRRSISIFIMENISSIA